MLTICKSRKTYRQQPVVNWKVVSTGEKGDRKTVALALNKV